MVILDFFTCLFVISPYNGEKLNSQSAGYFQSHIVDMSPKDQRNIMTYLRSKTNRHQHPDPNAVSQFDFKFSILKLFILYHVMQNLLYIKCGLGRPLLSPPKIKVRNFKSFKAATFLVLFCTPRVHLNKPYKKPMPPWSVTQLVLKLTGAKELTNQDVFSMNFSRLLFVYHN